MQVSRVVVTDFLGVENSDLELPPEGLVVVTAPNGLGKSARTLEAVSWGTFGKHVRAPAPERVVRDGGHAAVVRVVTHAADVTRAKSQTKSPTLSIADAPSFDTTTKAQAHLHTLLGIDHATWRKTHTVTTKDVEEFAVSTDSARKLFVESAAGLREFVKANALATDERKQAELVFKSKAAEWESANNLLKYSREMLTAQSKSVPSDPGGPTVQGATEALAERQRDVDELLLERQRLTVEVAAAANAVTTARRDVDRLSGGTCGLCKQPIPEGQGLQDAVVELMLAEFERDTIAARCGPELERVANQLVEATAAHRAASAALQRAHQVEGERRAVAAAKERVAALLKDVETHAAAEATARAMMEAAQREVELARATERSLSPKGFRGYAMAKAVEAVNALANQYLAWLSDGIRVKIKATDDEIQLEVIGAGGGGYGGCSDGQRRRIDLAVVFALGALHPARGTLFLDECLDHLDTDGVKRALRLLEHLSVGRCVVLITHNAQLVELLPKARHIALN